MGIDGLLQLLKPVMEQEHLSSFRGKTIGIDAFPWLYKGVYMHYSIINLEEGEQIIPSCSNYLLQMLDLMQSYQIKPYFVFDGRSLPMKKQTIAKRQQTRDSNQEKFQQLRDKKEWEQARKILTRTIRVTEEIICEAITVLKLKSIDFIVSPYETDSQLSKLWVDGNIDYVITEDSDLILYGCKKILYKLSEEGECDYLNLSDDRNKSLNETTYLKSFLSFSEQKKLMACVMAGCDYIPSIKGIGLKKAIKYLDQNDNISQIVNKLSLEAAFKDKIPQNYVQNATNATLIFKHALIYNQNTGELQYFNPLPSQKPLSKQQIFLFGSKFPQYIKKNIHKGECEPRKLTKRQFKTDMKIQTYTQVSVLRLKEIEEKNREKKEQKLKLQQQNEDLMDFNILQALETLKKPVTVNQFWDNSAFQQIISKSITYILLKP